MLSVKEMKSHDVYHEDMNAEHAGLLSGDLQIVSSISLKFFDRRRVIGEKFHADRSERMFATRWRDVFYKK